MAIAGYDPQVAPKFWERMAAQSGGESPPEFVSTHPSHDTRISDLNKWMPEAMQYYKPDAAKSNDASNAKKSKKKKKKKGKN